MVFLKQILDPFGSSHYFVYLRVYTLCMFIEEVEKKMYRTRTYDSPKRLKLQTECSPSKIRLTYKAFSIRLHIMSKSRHAFSLCIWTLSKGTKSNLFRRIQECLVRRDESSRRVSFSRRLKCALDNNFHVSASCLCTRLEVFTSAMTIRHVF